MPFAASVAPEAVGLSSEGLLRAFERFRGATAPSGQPLSGGVMVVSRRGQTCFVESFGVRDEIGGEPMTSDCVFNIASMTKSVTSVAAMMLFEEGKLGLDDPVSKWFPALAQEHLRVAGPNGTTVPCEKPMLVRHLMSHTSGLTYGFLFQRPEGDPMAQADKSSLAFGITPATPEEFAKCVLAFQPGTRFRYSCASHLLACVVEAASGVALDKFFKSRIFAPLGMARTAFNVESQDLPLLAKPQIGTAKRVAKSSFKAMLACTHEQDPGAPGPGELSPFPGAPGASLVRGDGGLHSTPEDWQRFLAMLLQRGEGVMSEETFRIMSAPSTPELDDPFFNTHMTDRPGSGGRLLVGQGMAHSLIGEVVVGPNALGASRGAFGWEGLMSTKYVVDPAEDLAVGLWANVAPCWRYALKQLVLPLIYGALEAPAAPHAAAGPRPPLAKL